MNAIKLHFPITITCPFCKGRGWIEEERCTLWGPYLRYWTEELECGWCSGKGHITVNSPEQLEDIAAEADCDVNELIMEEQIMKATDFERGGGCND